MDERITTFAERLQEALEIRGMKAVDLANKSGVPQSEISSYKSGRYAASQKNLQRLAEALDVSIPWLMGFDVPVGRYSDGFSEVDDYEDAKKNDPRRVLFDLSQKVRVEDIPQIEAILKTFLPEDRTLYVPVGKTSNATRLIPIPDKIWPLVSERLDGGEYLIHFDGVI